MGYGFKLSRFRTVGYVIFFFAMVDNRYMVYAPVLFVIYTLRTVFAFIGYYLVLRNLKSTGRTTHLKLFVFQLLFSSAAIFSGVVNYNITAGIIYSIFVWIGITSFILNSGSVNSALIRTIDMMYKLIVICTLLLAVIAPGIMLTYSYDGSMVIEGFFGGKNALPPYVLMGLCLNLIVYEKDRKKRLWRRYFYPFLCTFLLYYSGSGTGLVIAMAFLILFYTGMYKLLNTQNIIITHTVIFFSIVVYRLHERYLYPIVVNVLHRDVTLTYRTDIWTIAIEYFKKGWYLGYGYGNNAIAKNLVLPIWYQQTINETHNGILDIALSLGILGLIPFMLFIISILRNYDKAEDKSISQILKLYVFVYFVIAISESTFTLSRLTFWSMLFLGLVAGKRNPKINKFYLNECRVMK